MNNKENSNTAATLAVPGTEADCLTFGMLNHAPVRIKQAEWPVFHEVSVPVLRLDDTGDITSLPDLIVADRIKLAGCPDPLAEFRIPRAVRVVGSVRLAVRQHRDGRVLLSGAHEKQTAICDVVDVKSPDFETRVRRVLKELISMNDGHFVDEYESVAVRLCSAAKRAEPTINVTGITSLDGDCIWLREDEWTLLAEQIHCISAEHVKWDSDPQESINELGMYGFKRRNIAVKYLRILKNAENGEFVAIGGYLFEQSDKIDIDDPLPGMDELAPKYAVVRRDVAGIAQGLLDLGKKCSLPVSLVQGCLNALPTQDLR